MNSGRKINLETIYGADHGPIFMTGMQALVRLPLMQRRYDKHRGLNTAGLVSGYRGSPLGTYDLQLWRAEKYLKQHDIVFQPGLNEDLAATALWGAQMHRAFGKTRVDGVFGIWYGKGNGVDRTGDVFRNANALGTSALGGILAIAGDDHSAQSSMFPHQTDGIFQSVMMPVLQPANVSEILTLGMAGIALSRFSGLWVAMKTIAEVVESAATFDLPNPHPSFISPVELVPPHGLNWDPSIAWPAERAEYERRLVSERLPAAIGWAAANKIDRVEFEASTPRFVIVTVGKAHQDLLQALTNLGIGEDEAQLLGISIYKVGMSWPLAADPLLRFAAEAEEIFVVEEKSPTVEGQLKAALFNVAHRRPRITGKSDLEGRQLLPIVSEFSPLMVAEALVRRLPKNGAIDLSARLAQLRSAAAKAEVITFPARKPFFCSGCPHNTSTKTPAGSVSGGGIGCHVMALSQPQLKTRTFSQMGGEGMQWVGAAPFSETAHIFQNLGDGTYQHSGLLAIRGAVAAGTNITFKVLYNDAVAMTGGQPAEGALEPRRILEQLLAEGVRQVHLVSDDTSKWREAALPKGVQLHDRGEMDVLQRQLRDVPGVTAIVYEQTCAAEKRRRRKRGTAPDPDKRIFINERVCEGCGDCSVQSNCISVEPVETHFGVKRKINQSACNKDFSCIKGFCPSFVEIEGATVRKPDTHLIRSLEQEYFNALTSPALPEPSGVYNVYIAGIGGLGVLTTGALLGSAAYLSGMNATVLDFTGLAQKNGAVVSQVRIAPEGVNIHAMRVPEGGADLLLATDSLVAAGTDALRKFTGSRGALVLNDDETPTADIVTARDFRLPTQDVVRTLTARAGDKAFVLSATRIAEGLFGNNVAANTLIVGYAWQKGLLPLTAASIEAAIEANGAAIEVNKRAFAWGRVAAMNLSSVEKIAGIVETETHEPETLDALIARRIEDLTSYQDAAYADRYGVLMNTTRAAAARFGAKGEALVRAIAHQGYRLMAYKDEYEVARLYTAQEFSRGMSALFSKKNRVSVYLAPPLFSRVDPATGRPRKRKFGPWVFTVFRVLSSMRRLRGTPFDVFGYTAERKAERAILAEYIATVQSVCSTLSGASIERATALASLPDMIRGYGPVKEAAMMAYAERRAALLTVEPEVSIERAA